MMTDRESRILDAASECQSDEALARVVAGVLELAAQRGLGVWEALGRQITASAQQDEIVNQLEGLLDNMELGITSDDAEAFDTDERLDPPDGEIEAGEDNDDA